MIETLRVLFVDSGSDGSDELCRCVRDVVFTIGFIWYYPAGTQIEVHSREGGVMPLPTRYAMETQIHRSACTHHLHHLW